MRLSSSRIRSINRRIVRVNGTICGASDAPRQRPAADPKDVIRASRSDVLRIVAVPRTRRA